jgi:predicted secreted protein
MESGGILWLCLSVAFATACRAADDKPLVFQAVSDKEFKEMEIRVPAGSRFVLKLPSLQSSGYTWDFVEPLEKGPLKFVGRDDEPGPAVRSGAPGWELWSFLTAGPGRVEVKLKQHRSWETDRPPHRELLVKVLVE